MHLWSRLILRQIGDNCGGFLVVDEDTTFMADLRWARIQVMWDGKSYPRFVEVSVGPKRYEFQLWWEIQPFLNSANIPMEKSTSPGLKVEDGGDTRAGRSMRSKEKGVENTDGTRIVSSGSVRQIYPKSQEKVDLGSGQACGEDRGSGSACELDLGSGQAQGKNLGLDQDNRVVPSPRCNRRSHLAKSGSADPTHLKAAGMEIRPRQGPLLRPFMPSNFQSPVPNVKREGHNLFLSY